MVRGKQKGSSNMKAVLGSLGSGQCSGEYGVASNILTFQIELGRRGNGSALTAGI
jgi:hypothetical protein